MRDNKIFDLIDAEKQRQREGLELIPSENYVSREVLDAMGSVFTNKYSEGYPGFEKLDGSDDDVLSVEPDNFRYYGGQQNTDKVERLAIARACRLFRADHANVQPHSGAQANNAVYNAWLQPGDTVLGMNLGHGGHLTHGAPVTQSAKIYNFVSYGTNPETGDIDYDQLAKLAAEHRPKILLVGYSAFMKIPDFDRIAKIGQSIPGCLLMADMAHVAGLIAGGVHPNPLGYGFHVMTTTTHKTLRGPRGGLILCKDAEFGKQFNKAIFPGIQGGPLMHVIAAKAVAFKEALSPEFKEYARQIIKNAKVLADTLTEKGFRIVSGGTDNHLMLVDLTNKNITGKVAQNVLDEVGITANKNTIPFEKLSPFVTSGIRLGSPALTTRGFKEDDMREVANIIALVLDNPEDEAAKAQARERVAALCKKYPLYE